MALLRSWKWTELELAELEALFTVDDVIQVLV
jgi:hypothetical protein